MPASFYAQTVASDRGIAEDRVLRNLVPSVVLAAAAMLAMGVALLVVLLRDVGSGVDGEDLLKEPWWGALISIALFGGLAAVSLWMGYRLLSARVVLGAERSPSS